MRLRRLRRVNGSLGEFFIAAKFTVVIGYVYHLRGRFRRFMIGGDLLWFGNARFWAPVSRNNLFNPSMI